MRTFGQSRCVAAVLLALLATGALLPAGDAIAQSGQSLTGVSAADTKAAAETYADLVVASYDASIASATAMQGAIDAFLADPNEATLATAKQAWLAARADYSPTEAFRFYNGPIDNADDGPEGQLNAWPMDEAYVDYVAGNPNSGIINDVDEYPTITTDVLVEANENGGEENVSTGWHAIEFLLWGQDRSTTGAGQRPVTDYTTGANAARRAEYLRLVTALLVDDLTAVRDEWDADTGSYREKFLKNPRRAISNALRGIGMLSAHELAGERMAVAYETKDQEDEHSCFSDNTNADVAGNIIGVQRVYLADFPGGAGTSISDLVAQVNPKLDAKLRSRLDESRRLSEGFAAPFDQLIRGSDAAAGRTALLAAITAIEDQGTSIANAGKALGVKVDLGV
jgi:putative iron-regulated protein